MTLFRPHLALLLAASLCAGIAVPARGQLADSSPFAPVASGPAGGVQGDTSEMELRGILDLASGPVFCIYDVNRKVGTWAKLNVRTDDVLVRSYDASHEAVVVELGGRVMHLMLKESKVASDRGISGGGGLPQPGYGIPSIGDEARRLQLVAQEIQRRRMLRQQALRVNPPGSPGQPPGPPQQ